MISTSFWSADGKPISVQEIMDNMFGTMPEFFKSEEELRKIWSNPTTRKVFLDKIAEIGYGNDELEILQKMIDAEQLLGDVDQIRSIFFGFQRNLYAKATMDYVYR